MRYADLTFALHGYMPVLFIPVLAMPFGELLGGPGIHETAPDGPVVIERAAAMFPNGRVVSVLRGMCTAGAREDFETCRLGDREIAPIKHATIESVQAELDAVAALPAMRR